MRLEIGCYSPWGDEHHRPHIPQCQYLSVDRTRTKGISQTHLVGGRGSAKTTTGILWLKRVAFVLMPGVPGFWSEPRHGDLHKVFLREWARIVPKELWEFSNSGSYPHIKCLGGTVIDLVSRKVDNTSARVGLGPNYGFGFSDEAAEKFSRSRHIDLMNAIRLEQAPFRFFDTLSTPLMNGYYNWCTAGNSTIIHSSSYDNPFISSDAIDDMAAHMSENVAAQEIHGKWIRQEGRSFPSFSDAEWPNGNIHPTAEWQPNRPWFLGWDIGQGYGHWQIWQYFAPQDNSGRSVYSESKRLAVCVAEGMQYQATIYSVLDVLRRDYATVHGPVVCAMGSDVNTLGTTGPAPAKIIRQHGWPVWWPMKELSDPRVRAQCLDALILNTLGERRFCVARKVKRHGPANEPWGVAHALLNDTWPDAGAHEPFRKDKGSAGISNCEDPRDSTAFLASHQFPPSWTKHDRWAA